MTSPQPVAPIRPPALQPATRRAHAARNTRAGRLVATLAIAASVAAPAFAASSLTAYALSAGGESRFGAAGGGFSCATFGPDSRANYFQSNFEVGLPTDGAPCGVGGDSRIATVAGGGSLTVASTLAVGFGSPSDLKSYVGESAGRAGYGDLGVRASGSYGGSTNAFVVDGSQAFGLQTETMTFAGGVGAGRYRPTFTIDGSLFNVGRTDSQVVFEYSVDGGPVFLAFRVQNSRSDITFFTPSGGTGALAGFTTTGALATGLTTAGSARITLDIPITFGVATDVTFGLWAATLPSSNVGLLTASAGDVEFLSTAHLSGIEVLDASGAVLPAFSVVSGSGTLYDRNGVVGVAAIPEPSTVALFALGLAAFAARRARSNARR